MSKKDKVSLKKNSKKDKVSLKKNSKKDKVSLKKNSKKDKVSLKKNNIKNKKNRLHIIFSLYKLMFYSYNVNEHRELHGSKYRDISLVTNKKRVEMKFLKIKKDKEYIIIKRQYSQLLLNYCLENFDVSIWSYQNEDYVNKLLKEYFEEDLFDKLKSIIITKKFGENDTTFKDIKNNKIFKLPIINNANTKNLDYLFEDKFYSKMFNKRNTLILDTYFDTIAVNKLNSILVPKICISQEDNSLFKLFMWLYKNKDTKNIQKINKDILYDYKENLCKKEINTLTKKKSLNIGDIVKFNKKIILKNDEDNDTGIIINRDKNNYDIVVSRMNGSTNKAVFKVYKKININNIRKLKYN